MDVKRGGGETGFEQPKLRFGETVVIAPQGSPAAGQSDEVMRKLMCNKPACHTHNSNLKPNEHLVC